MKTIKQILFTVLVISMTISCNSNNEIIENENNAESLKTTVLKAFETQLEVAKKGTYKKAVKIETLDYETGEKSVVWDCIESGSTCDPYARKEEEVQALLSNNSLNKEITNGNIMIEKTQNYLLLKDKNGVVLMLQQIHNPGIDFSRSLCIVENTEMSSKYKLKAVIDENRGMLTCPEKGNNCRIGKSSEIEELSYTISSLSFNVVNLFQSAYPNENFREQLSSNKYILTSFNNGCMLKNKEDGKSFYIKF